MSQFEISSDVPLPDHRTKYFVYPFGDMKVGDSFPVTADILPKVRAAASWYGTRHSNGKSKMKFSVKKIGDDYRCWRVK